MRGAPEAYGTRPARSPTAAAQDRGTNMVADLFDLSGKLALVTGSSTGIGYALARGLGRAGARIVLNGRDKGRLEEAAASLSAEGLTVRQAVFDVTQGDEVRA